LTVSKVRSVIDFSGPGGGIKTNRQACRPLSVFMLSGPISKGAAKKREGPAEKLSLAS
jgi:hypothetical protein